MNNLLSNGGDGNLLDQISFKTRSFLFNTKKKLAQSAGAVEYADCICAEG